PASLQDLHEPVPGESRRAMSPEPDHLAVGDQGIHDRFLGRLHDGFIERVEVSPRNGSQLVVGTTAPVERLGSRGERTGIGGRETDEDVAGEMRTGGSGASESEGYPAGECL